MKFGKETSLFADHLYLDHLYRKEKSKIERFIEMNKIDESCQFKENFKNHSIRWEGGSGWGTHVNPWLIHVNVWQKPLQYCKVISLQLIKINEKFF